MPRPRPGARLPPLAGMTILAALLTLSGCVTPPGDQSPDGTGGGNGNGGGTHGVDTLDQGSYPQGPSAAEDRVIADPDSWAQFWQEHAAYKGGSEAEATPPTVDFEAEFVLLAYAGEKPTGGYGIEIRRVTAIETGHMAFITDLEPGPDCITTDALTYPFHLVRAPRSADDSATPEVRFEHETQVFTC